MENTAKIRALKEKIKMLSELQTKTKQARKTSLPKKEWEALKDDILKSISYRYNRDIWDHSFATSYARMRKGEITACLNLYHELRGSEYRHAGNDYWYRDAMHSLRADLKV